MIYGLNMLSIVPTIIIDQIRRPRAWSGIPVKNRNNIAGTVTTDVPIVGIKDATAATIAQIMALGTPKTVNPIQARIP